MDQSIWEKEYRNSKNIWGKQPQNNLIKYLDMIPREGTVLDIGMGEGRNALFLAEQGFQVEGIDVSSTAVLRCQENARKYGVQLDAYTKDVRFMPIAENVYSLVILSNVLNFFSDQDIESIMRKVKNGLMEKGLIYINVFDDQEPGKQHSQKTKITEQTYYDEAKSLFYHYFTKQELVSHFSDYQIISLSQTYGLDITHGDPHYHSTLELIVQK